MTYKVAIVDDEQDILQRVCELLKKYEAGHGGDISFDTETYSCGDEFLENSSGMYEIIFLDINMPGTNGLRVAKKIREHNETAIIIFCTHYAQYAINGYEVNALGYILKPINEVSFNRTVERMLNVLKSSQSRSIRIKTLHGVEVVSVADVLYLEIQIHNLFYYVLDKEGKVIKYRTRGSMQEMVESLGGLGFSRCRACYLVNLRHVISMTNGEVKLRSGITLPISGKFLKEFSYSFAKYLGNNGTINV